MKCLLMAVWLRLLLMQITAVAAAAAAGADSNSRPPQLRVLAVPLLPTSPSMDMMAVMVELRAR
jgi:hypothetical protein